MLRSFNHKFFSTIRTTIIESNSVLFNKNIEVLNRFAILLELKENQPQIVFPDKKLSVKFDLAKENQTIDDLLSNYKKQAEQDNVLGCSIANNDGVVLANNTRANVLLRLPSFNIIFDNGEKTYTCLNANYLGNTDINKEINTHLKINNKDRINDLCLNKSFNFQDACNRDIHISNKDSFTYKDLLNNIYLHKYTLMLNLEKNLLSNKEKRTSKLLNLFFYISTAQVVTLNLLTFVFLNWDIMEPITQCLTFANIILGYYFWALTKTSLDPPSISAYFTSKKNLFRRKYLKELSEERGSIERLINNDKNDKNDLI